MDGGNFLSSLDDPGPVPAFRIWHNPRSRRDIDSEMAFENPVDGSLEPMTVRTVRPSASEIFKSATDLNKASIDFLKIDLDTALTFAAIAQQSSGDDEKKTRNQHHARTGYDTVRRLIAKVRPTRDDSEILNRKLALLKSELIKLGERFKPDR